MEVTRTGIVLAEHLARGVPPVEPTMRTSPQDHCARDVLSDTAVIDLLEGVLRDFRGRHNKLLPFFLARFEQVRHHMLTDQAVSEERRLLIGAYFTQEYSLESAALFNPSLVWHPDQANLPTGSRRFIVSLRATGEGHISSITFRSGVVDDQCQIKLDEASRFVAAPDAVPNVSFEKALFERKLVELGLANGFVSEVMVVLTTLHLTNFKSASTALRRQRAAERAKPSLAVDRPKRSNYEISHSAETTSLNGSSFRTHRPKPTASKTRVSCSFATTTAACSITPPIRRTTVK